MSEKHDSHCGCDQCEREAYLVNNAVANEQKMAASLFDKQEAKYKGLVERVEAYRRALRKQGYIEMADLADAVASGFSRSDMFAALDTIKEDGET